jgi:hypothetical protein
MAKTTQNTETVTNEAISTPGSLRGSTSTAEGFAKVEPVQNTDVAQYKVKGTPVPEIEYNVLHFPSADKLQNAVSNALKQGWQLVGGICVAHVSTQYSVSTTFSQAIIRR